MQLSRWNRSLLYRCPARLHGSSRMAVLPVVRPAGAVGGSHSDGKTDPPSSNKRGLVPPGKPAAAARVPSAPKPPSVPASRAKGQGQSRQGPHAGRGQAPEEDEDEEEEWEDDEDDGEEIEYGEPVSAKEAERLLFGDKDFTKGA